MILRKLGDFEVQYISCYLTRKQQVLFGDRKRGMAPIGGLFLDEDNQSLLIKVTELDIEGMRSKRVKEGLDFYLIKSEVTKIKNYLLGILPHVYSKVSLDRSLRKSKDPRPTYINIGGLSIPIEVLAVPVKVNSISAQYGLKGFEASLVRDNMTYVEPSINIELENKGSWDQPRMHVGIHKDWDISEQDFVENQIIISIPWVELGHLLGSVTAVENRLP
jgi:hypothetical protein